MKHLSIARQAHLLHNPRAGDGERIKTELMEAITSCGYICHYTVADTGWLRFKDDTELIVIAGGDGTVRTVAKKLLGRKLLDRKLVVALVPLGTANNFAQSLGLRASISDLRAVIAAYQQRNIDVGAIKNLREERFFLEGIGVGVIPLLIKTMEQTSLEIDTADQELKISTDKLVEIASTCEAHRTEICIDGVTYRGDYLLAEILNIPAVGPNFLLAPQAHPADGKLHIALVEEKQRAEFVTYLDTQRKGHNAKRSASPPWQIIEAEKEVILRSESRSLHVDDQAIAIKPWQRIVLQVRPGILNVLSH